MLRRRRDSYHGLDSGESLALCETPGHSPATVLCIAGSPKRRSQMSLVWG